MVECWTGAAMAVHLPQLAFLLPWPLPQAVVNLITVTSCDHQPLEEMFQLISPPCSCTTHQPPLSKSQAAI